MRYVHFLLLLVILPGQAISAQEATTGDFAEGYYLDIESSRGPMYSLELPEEVYRTVRSPALNDIRIFNGAGDPVPHALRMVQEDPATLRDKRDLPFFPLYQEPDGSTDLGGLSLHVARDRDGAIVDISSQPPADPADRKITGYLLDLSDSKVAVTDLEFYWQKEADSSVFTVNIEESRDLVRWSPLVRRATLADLVFGGQQVEKRSIRLPNRSLQYLRLSWQEPRRQLELTEVIGRTRIIETRRKHRWLDIYNGLVQEKDGRLTTDFSTDYRIPVESAQLSFSQENSIARLAVQSRPDAKSGWLTRCEQVFYQLNFDGVIVQNEPCTFPPIADGQWRVAVLQDGAGLGSGKSMLSLRLGWQPSELVFIARGTPPYVLAFGSGKLVNKQENSADGMLFQALSLNGSKQSFGRAGLGKKILLGGQAALKSPAQPVPWKKWLLWTVLIFGVCLLAFMARSLSKEMNKAEEKRLS